MHPLIYAELLKEKIEKFNVDVFLVNTGWIGGGAMTDAKRISIKNTRAMITSILDGSINKVEFSKENYFGLMIPISLENVDHNILNPINAWPNKELYDKEAKELAQKFKDNFNLYGKKVEYLINSGPVV